MDLFTKYMNLVGYNEEQYIIQPNDAMNKIMSGAKQVQMELFKEADSGEIKLMVRTDGKVKIVKGDIAKNSILAIEKISGRENIIRDFLQDDTEIKMMNPTRDHASHNGFDITITALADGQYKITFTKPDAKIEKEEKEPIPAKRYISRNDVSGKESIVENEFFHADDTLMRGITFDDIITAVQSNEKEINEAAVRKVFTEIYRTNFKDAQAELRDSMQKIIKEAKGE